MKFGKRFAFLVSLISVIVLFSSCQQSAGSEYNVVNNDVIIIFTNNMECSLLNAQTQISDSVSVRSLGYAKIKALKDYARATTGSNVVLVDAGNFIYGSGNENILGQFTNGDEIIKVMNETGYDLVCLGDKDTNYGAEKIKDYMNNAKFDFLCANIQRKHDSKSNVLSKIQTGYVVRDFGTTKVAFIGLTTPETANAGYLDDWTVIKDDLATIVKDKISQFNSHYKDYSGLKYKVLVSNLGKEYIGDVISELDDVDFIIDGGSSDKYAGVSEDDTVKQKSNMSYIYYGHCGRYGEKVGIFRISGGKPSVKYMTDSDNTINKDDVLSNYIKDEQKKIESSLAAKIGTTNVAITRFGYPLDTPSEDIDSINWNKFKSALNYESFSGDLVADAFRKKAGARIAVVTAGTLGKKSIAGPDVKLEDCYNFLNHSNAIGKVEVTGAQLKAVFENSVRELTGSDANYKSYTKLGSDVRNNASDLEFNGFLQVSGALVRVDITGTARRFDDSGNQTHPGDRIKEIWVLKSNVSDDDPTDLSKYDQVSLTDKTTKYTLASTSYILSGCKEGYDVFNGLSVNYIDGTNGDLTEAEALADYIKSKGAINSSVLNTGRIKFSATSLANSSN